MSKDNSEPPKHPDGIPFPPGGIQTTEGPHGHQRIAGEAAKFLYAGFNQILRIVLETTYHNRGRSDWAYRAILQDIEGGVHLAGGGEVMTWIDLDYGWKDALAAVDAFMEKHCRQEDRVTGEVIEGEEEYYRLRASMN